MQKQLAAAIVQLLLRCIIARRLEGAHGGCDRDRPLRSAECFDPRAMRWLPIPAAGGAGPRRADHAIVYALAS